MSIANRERSKPWLVVVLAIAVAGCASVSPWNQEFVEVRTPNFVVTSSFGEDEARQLAVELEAFHAGALYALGLAPDARLPQPTRVVAFDDRGLGRPFAIRGESASLIPTVDAPTLMIRAPGDLAKRVDSDVRHRYAHRLLRALSKERPPLWYAEGRAQVAGTIRVSKNVAEIGRAHPEHATAIREWRRTDLAEVFDVTRLDDRSRAGRRDFDAASWALAHTILFDSPRKDGGRRALDRVRAAFESGRPRALSEATAALGDRAALAERVFEHLDAGEHRVDRIEVAGFDDETMSVGSLAPDQARLRLVRLAFALGRPALALEYLNRIEPNESNRVALVAARARALAESGESEEAWDVLMDGLPYDRPPVTAEANLDGGLASIEIARTTEDPELASDGLEMGRILLGYAESSNSRGPLPGAAALGLARACLVEGEEPENALEILGRARAAASGSLAPDLVLAEVRAAIGSTRAAALIARDVLSRSHAASEQDRARRFLDAH